MGQANIMFDKVYVKNSSCIEMSVSRLAILSQSLDEGISVVHNITIYGRIIIPYFLSFMYILCHN